MEQLVKQHKIIRIIWACTVFTLASLTVSLVGTKIEKCDIPFVTAKFSLQSLRNNTVKTVQILKEWRPPVKPEAHGVQHT